MRKPDLATIIGVSAGMGCILVGNILEGGHTSSLIQPTAAMIVLGGTLGAVMVGFPLETFIRSITTAIDIVMPKKNDTAGLTETVVELARRARKDGLVALENDVKALDEPFLRSALLLALDGTDSKAMRHQLETAIDGEETSSEAVAKVWEAAGGYAPTMGILGAVMGLIHVMSNLADVSKVGAGIAVAFVATIYGVGAANLFFLPIAAKIKGRVAETMRMREMALEGAIAIQEGLNPREIESLMASYVGKPGGAAAEA